MPDFLASYDLRATDPSPYTEFQTQATKLGWRFWVTASPQSEWFRLPNTTMEGSFRDRDAAAASLKAVAEATAAALGAPVYMDKWIVVHSDLATFGSNIRAPKR